MKIDAFADGSLVNTETGEILPKEEYAFIAIPRRLKVYGWFMAFQNAFEILAKDKELWGQPQAVLNYMFSRLDFENYISVQQAEIAEALDIERSRVSEAIRKLLAKGILLRGPKSGRTWSYKLNNAYGWKGQTANLQKERQSLKLSENQP